jgi:outer membrane protein OmpA-like peptidoglycan-associated protein
VVRTGDINNLGFGWPKNYDPFSGKSTPAHPFPWPPKPGAPDGTDRILLGSAVSTGDFAEHPFAGDGYTSTILRPCNEPSDASSCKNRQDSMPQPIVIPVGALPAKIDAVLFQIFVDDFQAPSFHSHFQASLNGTRIPSLEQVLNALEQTGPIGKLISVNLLPEYFPLLQSGTVKLLIDDPSTHAQDGYAVDFVRILVNPRKFQYVVSVAVTVKDWDKNTPIAGATVTAALQSAPTDASGNCELSGLPAGLVVATAVAPGYDANSAAADIVAGQSGHAEIQLHRHEEGTSALEKTIAQTGSAAIYGIHFDSDSAKLRPDSTPALEAVLGLINNHRGSRWVIAGHTDNQGNSEHNQTLSQNRAASVIAWLKAHGVDASRLAPQGFGASRPVADNATANGRAVNRRVEIATAQW